MNDKDFAEMSCAIEDILIDATAKMTDEQKRVLAYKIGLIFPEVVKLNFLSLAPE